MLISTLQDRADRELEARLNDHSYDESQLISFKVPITRLSYYNPSDQWERIEGSIEIGNVYYQYVKRRILEDSVEVMCIPNHTANKLQAMKRQGSHPLAFKMPVLEPYEFPVAYSPEFSSYRLVSTAYFYCVYIPFLPRNTEERPPSIVV